MNQQDNNNNINNNINHDDNNNENNVNNNIEDNNNDDINTQNMELEEEEDLDIDSKIASQFKDCYYEILKLFSCSNGTELINKLKGLEYEAGSVCARKMIKIGGWKCTDCEKNANSIVCQQCWSKVKDKHKDHDIKFNISTNGTCDCGDPNTLSSSLFCPKHKGPLTKEEDIQNYINKNFSKELIQSFEKSIEKFFDNLLPYIVDNIENKKNNPGFRNNMIFYVELINVLTNNSAIMHILSKIFLKNYKYKTKHFCLLFNDNEIKLIKNKEEHDCCCPLIRLLMSAWGGENQDVLFRFLLNYKLRKTMGVLYFLLNERFMKYFIGDFGEMSVQYIFEDVCTTTVLTPGLIEFYFESIFQIIQYFTNEDYNFTEEDECPLAQKIQSLKNEEEEYNLILAQKFTNLKNFIQRIFYDNIYLIKPESAKYLGNNIIVYKKLIDILTLFHNINQIESYYPHKFGFYKESFDSNIINAENYILLLFDLYVSILNFDNEIMVKTLFEYFSDIIVNKKFKQLNDNEFSFHYSLYRGFSIFLNRYCFHYINSIKSNDINDGYKNAIKYITNFKTFGEIILKDLFKILGYMNACGENFLNYYGELMPYYEIYYCEQEEFILRDFCLLRFILSEKVFQSFFSISNIYKVSSLENTYNIMEKYFFSKDSIPPNENILEEEDYYKFMKFNGKILKLILNMIRDNKSFIWQLGCSYQLLKNGKMSNNLTKNIILNDKKNINEICKQIIINEIISKENLNTYSNIMDSIFESIRDVFGQEEIEKLILSMTNKTLTINKKAKFSVKDEYLKYLDINSVYDFRQKSNIQKYINNFKKEKISIYNTYFYPFIKYENNLQNNIYKNFFFYQENFDIIFKLTELLITNEKYNVFQQFFLSELIYYWNIFFYVFEENNKNQEYKSFVIKNKTRIQQLVFILKNNSLNDNSLKDYCLSVVEKITKNELFTDMKFNKDNNIQNENKIEKKLNKSSIKDKLKNTFKNKFIQLEKVYNTEAIKIENKINEPCIYCLKPIEPNNILNLYGKVGNLVKDYLFSNSFYQTVEKEYKKNNIKVEFSEIYTSIEKTKGFNIYSCNHFIHNSCFLKLVQNSSTEKCPLCHQNVDLFIPCLTQYNNKDFYSILKGYTLSEKTKNNISIDDIMDNNKFMISLSEEEKNNIQKFKELIDNKDTKIYELIKFSKGYLFVFMQDIEIDKDDKDNKNIITEKLIEKCSEAFGNFLDFLENYDDKKNMLEHWKNLILIIRLLMKLDELDYLTAFNQLNDLLTKIEFLNEINFCDMILRDSLKPLLFQILFLISILFDYETIDGYEKYIMKFFLPLYSVQYFVRQILINNKLEFDLVIIENNYNLDKYNQYLQTNKNISNVLKYISRNIMLMNYLIRHNDDKEQKSINSINNDDIISFDINICLEKIGLSNYKSKSLYEIIYMQDLIQEKKNGKIIDLFFGQHIPNIKIIDFLTEKYIYAIKEYNINVTKFISPNLLGSCLPIEYNFINLQSFAIDFQYHFFEIPCRYCRKIGYPSLVCLTCGKKICNTKEIPCYVMNPIVEHNDECGGGRNIFINTVNYKAVLMDNKYICEIDIPFYVNKFGECIDSNATTKDIKLNEEEIKKALKTFINYTWTNYVLNK